MHSRWPKKPKRDFRPGRDSHRIHQNADKPSFERALEALEAPRPRPLALATKGS